MTVGSQSKGKLNTKYTFTIYSCWSLYIEPICSKLLVNIIMLREPFIQSTTSNTLLIFFTFFNCDSPLTVFMCICSMTDKKKAMEEIERNPAGFAGESKYKVKGKINEKRMIGAAKYEFVNNFMRKEERHWKR